MIAFSAKIRTTFKLIHARETRPFRIHELLYQHEESTLKSLQSGVSELNGSSDIRPEEDGFFNVFKEGDYSVRAGPIKHTSKCKGKCCSFSASDGARVLQFLV